MELTGTGLENGHQWELIPLVNNKCCLVCRHCGIVRRADGGGGRMTDKELKETAELLFNFHGSITLRVI
jgi:hypothetical protein